MTFLNKIKTFFITCLWFFFFLLNSKILTSSVTLISLLAKAQVSDMLSILYFKLKPFLCLIFKNVYFHCLVYLQLTLFKMKGYYLPFSRGRIQDNVPELLMFSSGRVFFFFCCCCFFVFCVFSANLCYAVVIATRRVPSVCLWCSLSELMAIFLCYCIVWTMLYMHRFLDLSMYLGKSAIQMEIF